jgi:hypothetical protein
MFEMVRAPVAPRHFITINPPGFFENNSFCITALPRLERFIKSALGNPKEPQSCEIKRINPHLVGRRTKSTVRVIKIRWWKFIQAAPPLVPPLLLICQGKSTNE